MEKEVKRKKEKLKIEINEHKLVNRIEKDIEGERREETE